MTLDFLVGAASGAAPAIAATAVITSGVIRRRAAIDPLTGIPGRGGLPALERLVRRGVHRGERTGVIALDMRGFKQVNDTYGHDAGDTVLRAVAQRLTNAAPVAGLTRLGGDEFAAVVTCPTGAGWCSLLTAIQVALADPVKVAPGVTVRPTATIGAAVASAGDDFDGLLTAADTAMYTARSTDTHVHVTTGGLPAADRPGLRVRDAHTTTEVAA